MRLASGERAASDEVWNISLGGVFIAMSAPLSFGQELQLEFSLSGPTRLIRCRGFVVWSTKSSPEKASGQRGIGVRLTDIQIGQMRELSASVGRMLGDAA